MNFIENFTIQEASELFAKRRAADAIENELFYHGDHLQERHDWRGYIGKKPPKGEARYAEIMTTIKNSFVSVNLIKEVVDRHLSGILGREPDWDLVSPVDLEIAEDGKETAEQKRLRDLKDEAVAALVGWWNDRNHLSEIFQKGGRTCLLEEKAIVAAFIPPGYRDENGNIEQPETLRDALDMLQFNVLTADVAGVFKEKDKYSDFGLYYTQKNQERYAELTWVNEVGETEFVVINRNKDNETEYEATPHDLNSRLYFYEMSREKLVTEQVRSQQKAANLAWTKLIKNLNIAGDRKIFGLNADAPDSIADGGAMTFLTGLMVERTETINGSQREVLDYKEPAVFSVDPVAVETFSRAFDKSYAAILGMTHQRHVLKAEQAEASGKSQIEARAEYEKSLKTSKTVIDPMGRWFIDFSLRLAAALCGRSADFEGWRVDFNSIVDAGPVDPETSKQDRDDLKEGLMSVPTYLSRRGSDDPDAEIARLEDSPLYKQIVMEKTADFLIKADRYLTLREKREYLFPDKTKEEHDADLAQLAKEDAALAGAFE